MEAVDRTGGEIFAQTVDDVLKCDKSLSFGNGDPN